MKVLLLVNHLNGGGITSYLYNLAAGLIEKGTKVAVFSSGGNREDDFKKLGVRILCFPMGTKCFFHPKVFTAGLWLPKFLAEFGFVPDILHVHTTVMQAVAGIAKKKLRVPVVRTYHGYYKPKFRPKWMHPDGAIAISEAVAKHVREDLKLPEEKPVKVVYTGIVTSYQSPVGSRELRKHWGVKEDTVVVGSLSRLSEEKGVDVLLRAFKLLNDKYENVYLIVAGDGPKKNYLQNLSKELGLDNVIFAGWIKEAKNFISALDFFIFPSIYEGLGIAVIEAMEAGVPVVASRVGGIPEILEDGKYGLLFERGSPQDLACVLNIALSKKDEALARADQAREIVEDKFSINQMAENIVAFYEETIGQK